MHIRQAVILVGGRGTRLGALTRAMPKPMLEVAGRPFVEHVIAHLSRFGLTDILLLAGFAGEAVRDTYHGRALYGAKLSVVVEPEALGTAGGLKIFAQHLAPKFVMVNGDTVFDADLVPLLQGSATRPWAVTGLVRAVEDVSRFGRVVLEADGRVSAFAEKSQIASARGLINAGTYLIERDQVLAEIDRQPCSFETDVIPRLVAKGRFGALESDGFFVDIGVPDSLAFGRDTLKAARMRPAAFLDRDGVINVDRGYTHRAEDLEFVPGAVQAIATLNRAGYYVVVISNQAGVARGYYDEAAVRAFHAHMQALLIADGAHIDAFTYCPHHPAGIVAAYTRVCGCRKPAPGLLEAAARDWPIDRHRSFVVGDQPSDLAAGRAFGIRGYRFEGGDLSAAIAKILAAERNIGSVA